MPWAYVMSAGTFVGLERGDRCVDLDVVVIGIHLSCRGNGFLLDELLLLSTVVDFLFARRRRRFGESGSLAPRSRSLAPRSRSLAPRSRSLLTRSGSLPTRSALLSRWSRSFATRSDPSR